MGKALDCGDMLMNPTRIICGIAVVVIVAACGTNTAGGGAAPADVVAAPADTAADVPVVPSDIAAADAPKKTDSAAPKDAATADTAAPESLDDFINNRLDIVGTPGLAFCLLKAGKAVLCKGYGAMDLDADTPVTPDSVFGVGALSQLVTGVAVMQQVEAGKLALDASIDTYLGYSLRNPAFADVPLTLRMLLTHTSSIQDPDVEDPKNDSLYAALYPAGDPTETLAQFADAMFKSGGKRYDAKTLFGADKPGTAYVYSGFSMALAGYIVEKVTGQSFDAYTKAKIFTPLAMKKTAWRLAEIDEKQLALPYTIDENGDYLAYEPYGAVDYPDSGLHTSVNDFARFVLAFILDGTLDGAKILEKASVAEMRKIQNPKVDDTQGLVWYHMPLDGIDWLGSAGGDFGYSSETFYRVSDGLGFVLFSNGEWLPDDETLLEIEDRLTQEAEKL